MNKPKIEDGCGDVFTIQEFFDMVNNGCINNYDGYGSYSDGIYELESIKDIYLLNPSFSHVVWYNK